VCRVAAGSQLRFTPSASWAMRSAHSRLSQFADSVSTHPAVIRRILSRLAQARLVRTTEGERGGTSLARPTARITLAQGYRAVEGGVRLFATPRTEPNALCPVGRRIRSVLKGACTDSRR